MQGMTTERLLDVRGESVWSNDDQEIGRVEEIFVDEETGQPEWIGIGTGFFGTKRVLVPAQTAEVNENGVYVPYAKDHVKDAPDIDSDEISQSTEAELAGYYGLEYSEARSDSGLPEGSAPSGGAPTDTVSDDASITRSEEELAVGKRQVETGKARLRKWVETEPVELDVELQRETAQVHREPVNEVVTGAELGEQEIEVPLHAEEAVVQKETVAKERISVDRDVETTHERVSDEVRKEQVEIEGDR
jgi:uncharacterized protein (TIGR02271 family)